jgi:N-acyl-D-amino-acid deacylase
MRRIFLLAVIPLLFAIPVALVSSPRTPNFDVVLRNGLICDGTALLVLLVESLLRATASRKRAMFPQTSGASTSTSHGQIIAPGFINLMSGPEGLFADGRGLSDLMQGVTLEVFGEGESMGRRGGGSRRRAHGG